MRQTASLDQFFRRRSSINPWKVSFPLGEIHFRLGNRHFDIFSFSRHFPATKYILCEDISTCLASSENFVGGFNGMIGSKSIGFSGRQILRSLEQQPARALHPTRSVNEEHPDAPHRDKLKEAHRPVRKRFEILQAISASACCRQAQKRAPKRPDLFFYCRSALSARIAHRVGSH